MIHVAVGLLRDSVGRVLINQRKQDGRHPGRWEFPGGKLEPGESPRDALARELREELGIEVVEARKRIRVRHRYEDFWVELDVRDVVSWRGDVQAREGHVLRWQSIDSLRGIDLLEADRPIVTSLRLPPLYAVTPDLVTWRSRPVTEWLVELANRAQKQNVLLQLRLPDCDERAYAEIASELGAMCGEYSIGLMLNGEPAKLVDLARRVAAIGIQVPARFFSNTKTFCRVASDLLIGASCHNANELRQASEQGADFALLGTVNATASHPDIEPVGWSRFEKLVETIPLPVFAIGGVSPDDLDMAWAHGAQGVAGISAFWDL